MTLHSAVLIDDELFTRKGLMKLIDWEACGFRIIGEADNGEDALELVRALKPDLVITDIRMPVLDGLELIHQITEDKGDTPAFIIISGYSDFKYAQQAVRYGVHDFVLKPIDEIEFGATLRKLNDRLNREREERARNERLLADALIETLIVGDADETFVAEAEQKLKLRPNDRLRYVFAELNDNHPWRAAEDALTLARFKELVQLTVQELSGGSNPVVSHEHRNRIGILVPDALLEPFGLDVAAFAGALRNDLSAIAGAGVFVYAGTPVDRMADIRESYASAKEALLYKYANDESRIVVHDQAKSEPLRYIGIGPDELASFVEQVEEQRPEAAIEAMFGDFQAKRYAPEAIKMNIHQCVLGVSKAIRSMGGDENSLASLAPIVGWHDLNVTIGELKRLFSAFAQESGSYIAGMRKDQLKGGIQKIKSYIETNYAGNISLKSIAALFYINPVYLGQLFKKTYGVYFNDFLLQIRINEAKKLLRQSSDLRIYEVAEKVGFGNADYFVTQFEKIEHMTPTEYRNKLL